MEEENDGEITGNDGKVLVVVGIYGTRTEAYERSLVVAAMEVPHWVLKQEEGFALCVEEGRADAVKDELRRFEEEEKGGEGKREEVDLPVARHTKISLYVFVWVMSGLYMLQLVGPKWWMDRGTASSEAIMKGEWWRAVTALTLHAGLGHLVANVVTGLVYAGFLLPLMGAGWTWFLIVLTGGLGNWLNAWGNRGGEHLSIGASTAVFGALGMLVAAQCTLKALAVRRIRMREFLIPVGAGFGLLAYLGTGDQQTDYMAHLLGLMAGAPLGVLGLRLGTRTPRGVQIGLAWGAVGVVAVAWWMAARR